MKKLFTMLFAVSIVAVGFTAGCGGGGSVAPILPVSKDEAKGSASKSVAFTADLDNELGFSGGNYAFSSGRRLSRLALTITETDNSTTYTNEVDPDTGCTQNGSLNFTNTSDTTASISGTITATNCTSSYDNGIFTMSGSMAVINTTSASVSMTTTFAQTGSTLKITMPITGTVGLFDDSFTQSNTNTMTLSGKDIDNYTYTSFVITENAGSLNISGRITDTSGFFLIYSNTTMTENGAGTIHFTTSDGVTGTMTVSADGSGSATLTQTSDGSALLTATWAADGSGTITYADSSTESITMDV